MDLIKSYEAPFARVRLMYRIPSPPVASPRILELAASDERIAGEDWAPAQIVRYRIAGPGIEAADPGDDAPRLDPAAPLPFAPGAFDVIVMHFTLDRVAFLSPGNEALDAARSFLGRLVPALRPGGLLVGCGMNASDPRHLLDRFRSDAGTNGRRPALGVLSCRSALQQAGLEATQVFNLLPDASSPRGLISVDAEYSRRAFRRELEITRDTHSTMGYLIRRMIVGLALNRYIEPTLFYWGYRKC